MNYDKKKHIVYIGCTGFPYGFAEIQKIILISKSLVLTGNHVTIVCDHGYHSKKDHPDLKACGIYEDIEYVYTSGDPFRNENFIKRNLLKIKGKLNEFLLLRKRKKGSKLDFAILSTHSFSSLVYYFILSKLIGFKTILNYVEFYSGVKKEWFQISNWLNDNLFDKYAPILVDTVFPISEFIINHLKEVAPDKKYLKVPVLTDFERYNGIEILKGKKYFLFCGSASYKEIIYFIIDSFDRLKNTSILLYLVINGNENDINDIRNYLNNTHQKNNIKLLSKLTDNQLFTYYKNATALLIPLRPTYQDIARFPHKIGEYFASENPIISTNYGEVKYYFQDMEHMLLADSYNLDLFADKMQFVIDNPTVVEKIGLNGSKLAGHIFDYRIKATDIDNFLNSQL